MRYHEWEVVKGTEKKDIPRIKFTSYGDGVVCDRCHRIVPIAYTESWLQNSPTRSGYFFVCKDVWNFGGKGMLHTKCGG